MAPPLLGIRIVKYCGVWGGGGAKILQKIMAPPLSVIKIEQYCDAKGRGGGALGTLKSYKDNGAPSLSLRLLSIEESGEVGGGIAGRQNTTKDNGAPLSVIKIVKYCGVGGGGGALIRGRKNPTQIMAPPLPVIKIVKYCDVWRGGHWGGGGAKILDCGQKYITYKQYNCILPVTVTKCTI